MKWSIHKKPDTPQTRNWKTFFENLIFCRRLLLFTCQKFCDLFLFGLVWQYILQFRQNIIKVGSKSWLLTCNKVEIILEQRYFAFLSPSKSCENLNFSREIQILYSKNISTLVNVKKNYCFST